MADELIDVLSRDGSPTGTRKLKSEVHRDGDWHRSVHLWILTPDDRILMQRRAATKESHPRMWDISVAGHLSAGEAATDGAQREAAEELGLWIDRAELLPLGTVRTEWLLNDGRFLENEWNDVYLVRMEVELASLTLQAEEVDEVVLSTPGELRARVERRDPLLVPHWEEYAMLLSSIGATT